MVALTSVITVLGLSLINLAQADCSNFTAAIRTHGDTTYTSTGSRSYRLSALVNCTSGGNQLGAIEGGRSCNSTQCPIGTVPDLFVRVNRTLNITTSSDASQNIFELAYDSFQLKDKINYNASSIYSTTGVSSCIPEGQAGYWGFTPKYYCVDGTVSGCEGDGYPADGTPVSVCAVGILANDYDYADGAIRFVTTGGLDELGPPANATADESDGTTQNGATKYGKHIWAPIITFIACALFL